MAMRKPSPRARKIVNWIVVIGIVLHIIAAGFVFRNIRDRNPGYELDLSVNAPAGPLSAGFAALPITPEIPEPWTDKNGNGRFEEDIDTWEDRDGDGELDAVWMAGFQSGRAAAGIHDDLWARSMIIDNGSFRISFTVLDAIGIFHDEVLDIRESATETAGVDYSIVACTHVHEAPDLMGLWGKTHFSGGVDPDYLDYVKQQAAESIRRAADNLQPAVLNYYETDEGTSALVRDSRLPIVKDTTLRLLKAVHRDSGATLGILAHWADHPETLWSRNLEITSDFPHFFRQGLEEGIFFDGELKKEGAGGIALYANGAIGGLLTTDPTISVRHPYGDSDFSAPSFEKAEAQGARLAGAALDAMRKDSAAECGNAAISVEAATMEIPLDNPLFIIGSGLGILDRGHSSWLKLRTEVAVMSIGPFTFLCLPGEVYPELVYGSVTTPQGRDFPTSLVPEPSLIEALPGKHKFVLGLANDEIGYVIPKSEWDEEYPYLYGKGSSPYGEMNSPGPETGNLIHSKAVELIMRMEEKLFQ